MIINVAMLTTARLELVSQTAELANIESMDHDKFLGVLDATLPESWPPEFYDESARKYLEDNLAFAPHNEGWFSWFFVLRKERLLIGVGGFKGRPSNDGTVELGYSIVNGFQRRGYATEAAGSLVSWAFSHDETRRVIAQTLPSLISSIRVLEKNNFRYLGKGYEEGSICFEIDRAAFER